MYKHNISLINLSSVFRSLKDARIFLTFYGLEVYEVHIGFSGLQGLNALVLLWTQMVFHKFCQSSHEKTST